ncbi:trace amine-associated receptor 13c-like [Engraulis encrasicolus]|uniref:trace amine-associated receptor 13c-like n=1 Tax=Engraulis encrasicolus TaxID=184585 RepID=UPI002FD57281
MTLDDVNISNSCLLPTNSSCPKTYLPVDYVLFCITTCVVIFTLCGNLTIVIAICHFKQLHTPTNALILSLAATDAIVGLFVMPIHALKMLDSCTVLAPNFCFVFLSIVCYFPSVSVFNILLIAVDRHLALSRPFLYSKVITLFLARKVILFLWIALLFYNYALLYFNGNFQRKCPGPCFPYVGEVWAFVDMMLVFLFPCATIIILYLKVFFIARRHAVKIREVFMDKKRLYVKSCDSSPMALEIKTARVLGIIVSAFLMCLIPYYVISMQVDTLKEASVVSMNTASAFFMLNSAFNPIIYALSYSWFRKSLKLIFTFKICSPDSSLMNIHSKDV